MRYFQGAHCAGEHYLTYACRLHFRQVTLLGVRHLIPLSSEAMPSYNTHQRARSPWECAYICFITGPAGDQERLLFQVTARV